MPSENESMLSDDLFLTIARSKGPEDLESLLISSDIHREVVSAFVEEARRLRSISIEELAAELANASHTLTPYRGLLGYWVICAYQSPLDEGSISALQRDLNGVLPASDPTHAYLAMRLWLPLYNSGRLTEALSVLERTMAGPANLQDTAYGRYVQGLIRSRIGQSYQELGDLRRAQENFSLACETARSMKLEGAEARHAQNLGMLLWASGQYKQALQVHTDPRLRGALRNLGSYSLLISSHLSAAKCAIDAKEEALAGEELAEARRLMDSHPGCRADYTGYMLLFSGELEVQNENFERGETLIQQALTHFESMDPPHHPGALDAKIALCHFALYEGEYRIAFQIIQKLLEEAEQRRCLEARSRLLLLETCLYVTDDPPLRKGFDDLVTRLHLINNPAVLFKSLGNLYAYALEHLDEREQAFLLMRIKNLRPVLEESCFGDLYRDYVSERYEYAIENRLARFVDKDWDGGEDWQEPDEETDPEEPAS